MRNPARPRAKAVKTADGKTSIVHATPTIDEYRAAEQAHPAKSKPKAEIEQPAQPALTPLEEAQALLRPKSKLIRSNPANMPKAKCSNCGRPAQDHPVNTHRGGRPFYCSGIVERGPGQLLAVGADRARRSSSSADESEDKRFERETAALLAHFREGVARKPRNRPRRRAS